VAARGRPVGAVCIGVGVLLAIVVDFDGKTGIDRVDQEAASCQLRGVHFDHEGPCID
jgi:hypothetical protein